MECPRCEVPTQQAACRGMTLDTCETCQGIWFEGDELKRVMSQGEAAVTESALGATWDGQIRKETLVENPLGCPKCNRTLERYRYCYESDVLVDGCPAGCGMWVDDGELRRMMLYLSGSNVPLEEDKQKSLDMSLRRIGTEARFKDEVVESGLWLRSLHALSRIFSIRLP
ncbi:MAG: zf-TFIIB domain-containing protein [Armatimonadetes bacterium]|nr:zf-TFIIB domain-containing protein [Armatimonadota bacterium]